MKRFFSLFLCLLMLISLLPISALAEEDAGTGTTEPEAGDAGRDDFGNDGTDDTGTGEIDETGMDDVGNVGTDDAGNAVDFYISEHDIAMNAWETAELFTNLGGESVIWISEDEEIASVDEAGTVTAHRQGNTVITAVADLPGGPAEDSCDIEVLSTGYLCRSPDELESSHPYAPGEDAVWQYTLPGASELLVSFDEQTALDEGSFLILADGEGEELVDEAGSRLSFSGEWLPDRPIRLPGDTFRIYLFTNPDGEGAWGFRVSGVSAFAEPEEQEEETFEETGIPESTEENGEPEESPEPGEEAPEKPEAPDALEESDGQQEPEERKEPEETGDAGDGAIAAKRISEALPPQDQQPLGPRRTPDPMSSGFPALSAPAASETRTEPGDASAASGESGAAAPQSEAGTSGQEGAASTNGLPDTDTQQNVLGASAAPTATITLLPASLTMDAMTEGALVASVIVPEGTDLSRLSIVWETDSPLITVAEKDLIPNETAHSLTGSATVTAGSQRTETPAAVTATVMLTADDGSEPVPVKVSEAEDAAEARAESAVTVRNSGIIVSDWHQLESQHYYSRPIHTFWQYTVPDPTVQSVTLTFDTLTETVSPQDILRVTDGAGRPAGIYTGKLLSGQSVTVDSRVVRICLDSDETGIGAWGFKVTNLTTVSTDDAPRYSVRYYANGGVNAPKDQPARELPLTLSTDEPIREHYLFRGWATDRDSGATYQPGEVIETVDPNTLVGRRLDLFAVWERIPTYNEDNRGAVSSAYSGPAVPASETKTAPANPILIQRPDAQYDKDILHIKTAEDLMTFAENCSLDTWSDGLPVVLDNDLSLSGVDFWAVPFFNGSFDGCSHTIYDMSLTDAMAPCGFFLELGQNGTVKNLNVVGSVAPGGDKNMTGGLVGLNRGLVLNCSFSGTVSGTTDTGGIAGCNEATGILSGCRSTAAVSGMNATGGIAGRNRGAIVACESCSFVNIDSVDPALDIQTLDTSSILNFIESLSSDTVGVTADTGGIVGFNEGFVETSIARETVGYQHLGYNVGGIAGRSDGYIDTCLNEADVYGRRDVGGILGQAEPYIELREDNSIAAGLSYRVFALHRSIEAAANDAEILGDDIADQLASLSDYVLPLEFALAEFDIDNPTVEALELIRQAVRTMVSGVSGELESMGASVDEGSSVLSDDLNSISDNISALSGSAIQSAQLISSARNNAVLEDISVSEAESELTLGKTSGCTNRGEIRGDNNVGGIVGCMSVENGLDPENDLTNTDFLTRRQNRYRIVVAECLNDGPVTAKKECAGGIAGRADIGYIARSVAYNSIALEDGDYAGGIAGLLYGTAGACVAKCSLTGSKYVGGIVGNGYSASSPDEKPSLVFNCYTLVDIHDRPQFSGAVSGGGEGDYSENRFVPSGYAGLNRLSIQGQAEPVLFSVFSSLNTLPEESKHFTLRFVSEGETVKEIPFEYGASFGRSVFPEMPVKDGAYAVWDRTELTDLRFDTVVTAEYRRSETALKSDLCREDGRAVGYVIGQFQQGDTLKVERIPVEQGDIESFLLNWRQAAMEQLRSVLSGEPDYSIPISVLEHAEFRFPEDGLERHTLRYLSPNGATENIRVYQKSGGSWVRLQPEIFGSYLSVLSDERQPELCLVETMQSWWILVWAAGALAVLILLILIVRQLRKRRKARPPKQRDAEQKGKLRTELHRRRKLLLVLLAVLAVVLLGLTVLLQSGRLQAGITGYRVLRDFYGREADIDAEIRIAAGDEEFSLDSTVHRLAYRDSMISCADQYGIPLYISGSNIYLENGRAFRILSRSLDSSSLVRIAREAFRKGSVDIQREEDTMRCSAELDTDSVSKTIRSLLGEEVGDILTVDRLRLAFSLRGEELSELTFLSEGMLEDGEAFRIDVVLHPMPLSERPAIPQAVMDAIDAGDRGTELLTDDFLALLAAWIRYDRAGEADALITVKADAGLLSLNDQYGYFRTEVEKTKIHCVSSRLFTVYFTDRAACTANGTGLGNAETAIMDAAKLITAARELCLDGSFSCENLGSGRVYTLTIPKENAEKQIGQILPDLAELDIGYEDCMLRVTLRDDALYSLELQCSGTLKIVTRDLDASADVIVRFTEPKVHRVPDSVAKELLS